MGVMGLNMLSKKATGFIRTFTLCYAKITAFCRDIGEMVHFERVGTRENNHSWLRIATVNAANGRMRE